MKQLYLTPFMTVFCVQEDVLTASDESTTEVTTTGAVTTGAVTTGDKPFHYNDGAGDGGSVPFAG